MGRKEAKKDISARRKERELLLLKLLARLLAAEVDKGEPVEAERRECIESQRRGKNCCASALCHPSFSQLFSRVFAVAPNFPRRQTHSSTFSPS